MINLIVNLVKDGGSNHPLTQNYYRWADDHKLSTTNTTSTNTLQAQPRTTPDGPQQTSVALSSCYSSR